MQLTSKQLILLPQLLVRQCNTASLHMRSALKNSLFVSSRDSDDSASGKQFKSEQSRWTMIWWYCMSLTRVNTASNACQQSIQRVHCKALSFTEQRTQGRLGNDPTSLQNSSFSWLIRCGPEFLPAKWDCTERQPPTNRIGRGGSCWTMSRPIDKFAKIVSNNGATKRQLKLLSLCSSVTLHTPALRPLRAAWMTLSFGIKYRTIPCAGWPCVTKTSVVSPCCLARMWSIVARRRSENSALDSIDRPSRKGRLQNELSPFHTTFPTFSEVEDGSRLNNLLSGSTTEDKGSGINLVSEQHYPLMSSASFRLTWVLNQPKSLELSWTIDQAILNDNLRSKARP